MTSPKTGPLKRVVIVDDDDLVCDVVASTLTAAGFQVDIVNDGRDAVDAIFEKETDLIILDCNLPGRPGMVLLDDIRRSEFLRFVPVLMLTSRTSQWHAKLALNSGAAAYLRKPFKPADLTVVVTKLLNGTPITHIPI